MHEPGLDVVDGDRGRAAALASERAHLPEQLAGTAQREHDLAAVGPVGDKLDASAQHEHDLFAGGAGVENRLVASDLAAADELDERLGVLGTELPQERDVTGAHRPILSATASCEKCRNFTCSHQGTLPWMTSIASGRGTQDLAGEPDKGADTGGRHTRRAGVARSTRWRPFCGGAQNGIVGRRRHWGQWVDHLGCGRRAGHSGRFGRRALIRIPRRHLASLADTT